MIRTGGGASRSWLQAAAAHDAAEVRARRVVGRIMDHAHVGEIIPLSHD